MRGTRPGGGPAAIYSKGTPHKSFSAKGSRRFFRVLLALFVATTLVSNSMQLHQLSPKVFGSGADINGDQVVDYKDLAILAAAYGKRKGDSGYNEHADLNGDNIIDYKDLAILAANYGTTVTSTTVTSSTTTGTQTSLKTTTTTGPTTSTTTVTSPTTTSTQTTFKTTTTTGPTTTTTPMNYTIFIDLLDGKVKARNVVTGGIDFSGADAAAVLQRVIDALSNSGGSILLERGTYVWQSIPTLPRSLPNWLKIVGEGGVTIRLTSNGPRAFDFKKIADYDTFQNIWVENLTIDCNNLGGRHHVVLGTYISGTPQTRINIQDIKIRSVRTVNVPVDPTLATFRVNVALWVNHPGTSETQTKIQRILIEDCDFSGGNIGVAVYGDHVGPSAAVNVFLDEIDIHRCRHSLGSAQARQFDSANFHVGSAGFGGSVHISDCYGEYSADTGVEVNAMTHVLVENTEIRDALQGAFLQINYNNPQYGVGQEVTFHNCHAKRISLAAGSQAKGFIVASSGSYATGTVIFDDCTVYSVGATHVLGECLQVDVENGMTGLVVDRFKVAYTGITHTSGSHGLVPISIEPRGGSVATHVTIRDVDIIASGSVTGGTLWLNLISLEGSMYVDMSDVRFDVNITNLTDYATEAIVIGPPDTVSTIDGVFKRIIFKRIDDLAHPDGFLIGGTARLTIPDQIRIENCEFTDIPPGNEVVFQGTSNAAKVYF